MSVSRFCLWWIVWAHGVEGMGTFRESSYTCAWHAGVTHPFGNALRELWHVKCAPAAVWWLLFSLFYPVGNRQEVSAFGWQHPELSCVYCDT